MKHPLSNPSLTPHGFGVGNTYVRTSWKSDDKGRFNGDWGAARYWQEANRLSCTYRPAEHIVHEIMPGMRTLGRTSEGDIEFAGRLYRSHDLAVLSRVAVWLGCNCGQSMLRDKLFQVSYKKTNEFRVRWRENEKPQSAGYLLRMLLHECRLDTCGQHQSSRPCYMYYRPASECEELALDAFLIWLGTESGRTYIKGLEHFIQQTATAVWNGYKQRRDQLRQQHEQAKSAS